MLRFRRMRSLQKFAAVHASVYEPLSTRNAASTSRHQFQGSTVASLSPSGVSSVPPKFRYLSAN